MKTQKARGRGCLLLLAGIRVIFAGIRVIFAGFRVIFAGFRVIFAGFRVSRDYWLFAGARAPRESIASRRPRRVLSQR